MKMKISPFIGRQLSRLKMGIIYFTIGMTTFTAIGVLKIALPEINFWLIVLGVILVFLGTFFLGYLMDITNVNTMDYQKTVEMSHRYLTVLDEKNNDFRMFQMKVMGEWIDAVQENRPVDKGMLDREYKKFLKKWSPPKKEL